VGTFEDQDTSIAGAAYSCIVFEKVLLALHVKVSGHSSDSIEIGVHRG